MAKQNKQTFDQSNMGDLFGALGFDKPKEEPTKNAPPQYKIEKKETTQRPSSDSTTPNIGWLFYNDYYKGLTNTFWEKAVKKSGLSKEEKEHYKKNHFDKKNEKLLKQPFNTYEWENIGDEKLAFKLTTTYPGLVLGTGYTHETGTEGEFKLGFYFDWTTGLPVIPASSVKGVLRSAFKTPDLIKALLQVKDEISFKADLLETWEAHIFGSENGKDPQKGSDIFYDAVIVEAPTPFLANDFITPHINREKKEMSPFSNPTPLMFLKVLPNVTFQFRFKLNDSDGLSASDKSKLFKRILILLGIGAKTNVGYGYFQENM